MWDAFKKLFSINHANIGPTDLKKAAIVLQYPAIKNKWREIMIQNWENGLKEYPSEHLLGNEEKWQEMVIRQGNCSDNLNRISWIEFKNGYNFSEEDWEKIKKELISDLLNEAGNKKTAAAYQLRLARDILLGEKSW